MKKKFLLFLICVAIVATSLVVLVACADDKIEDGTGGGDPSDKPVVTYDNPHDFSKALSVATEWTDNGEGNNTSINSKCEFTTDDSIAKYIGEDLWIWKLDDDIWQKAKISKDNAEYLYQLKMIREGKKGVVEDLDENEWQKHGDYWVVMENGEFAFNQCLELIGNKGIMYSFDMDAGPSGAKEKFREFILEADITLPADAEDAETITEEEMFGYDNPHDFFNAYATAEDWTMLMFNEHGGDELRVSANAKGEILYFDAGNGYYFSKYINNQLWLFVQDMKTKGWNKAKVDPNSQKYLGLKSELDEPKEGITDWLKEVEFVKDGEYWYTIENGEIYKRNMYEPSGKSIMVYQEYEGKIIQDESYSLKATNIEVSELAEIAKEVSAEEIFAMI